MKPKFKGSDFKSNGELQSLKKLDFWDLRILGKKPTTSGRHGIGFVNFYPAWFKDAVKEFLWSRIASISTSRIIMNTYDLRRISKFIQENNYYLKPEDLNRKFVIELINYASSLNLSSKTMEGHFSTWKAFFEFCQENEIIPLTNKQLIFRQDFPKVFKSQVKNIPINVLKQLKSKMSVLPQSIILMIEILLETGIRVNELCELEFDCIQEDSDGDYWLDVSRSKVGKESLIFISQKLANQIKKHQEFIRSRFQYSFGKLFCTTKNSSWFRHYGSKYHKVKRQELNYFVPVDKPIHQEIIRGYLKQLASEHNITDISGEIYPIWKCHRFRHTHLTDLARKGVGIAHIMQRAGHATPQMALNYIHLTNDDQKKKMKEIWDNTHFNMEGEIVAPVNPDLDTAEMQWIKKGMGMQTTDNGYCTLLWTQICPHQDLPCKGCGSWVTTLDFLDSHKKELEETERIIENARQKGYQRQIEKNVPRAERLKKIISGMEEHQTMRGLGHNDWEEKE